jgi:fatty acid desaturase
VTPATAKERRITTATQTPRPASASYYGDLKRILTAAGLRDAQPRFYITKSIVNAIALAGVVALSLWSPNPVVLVISAMLWGFMLTQNGLLGHDVAHRQVFRRGRGVAIGGWILGNLLMGVSYTWWTRKHNIHHQNPNHITADPDANYPMLAMFPEQVAQRSRWAQPIIAIQPYIYPILGMFLFVTFRAPAIEMIVRGTLPARIPQAIGFVLHFVLFGLLLSQLGGWPQALTYLVVSQIIFSLYMVSVFAPNHKGMKMMTDDESLDFFHTQVLTARNIRGSRFVDFWYGGLNYQIEHHLFPTLPRNRLSEAQPIVEQFCAERGISYHQTSLVGSYAEIFRHLKRSSAGVPTSA